MHLLERPAAPDELAREPVEELRVRGRAALRAERVRRLDNALAEVMHPNAVRDDARGERVIRAGNPLCQLQAAGFAGGDLRRGLVQHREETARGLVSG